MIVGPQTTVDWHAQDSNEVLRRLSSTAEGLATTDIQHRLKKHGTNALPKAPRRTIAQRILSQFNNILIYVLIGSGAVTALLGHWTDTIVILAVVLINAAIGFWQEGRAEDALDAVRRMVSSEASVLRDGKRQTVATVQLVPGDVVLLEAGDKVPADLRLIEVRGLRAQEAAITGESAPVTKDVKPAAQDAPLGDRASMAFSGTLVTSGRAKGVVVATGLQAEIGRIGAMLSEIEEIATPLLRQIDHFARILTIAILSVCVAVFAYAISLAGYTAEDAFLAMVGMAVAAIPEGLPAVLTITLALGVQRMAGRHAIIRRLPAVETLGAVSVICTDKTGTLTLNEMVARSLVLRPDAPPIHITGDGYAPEGQLETKDPEARDAAARLAISGALCNDARLRREDDGWVVEGDPMEGALLALAGKLGLDPEMLRETHHRKDDIPFDAAHKFMATLNQAEANAVIHVKGAPDSLLDMCLYQTGNAGPVPIDRGAWIEQIDGLAAAGHRVLAFASKAIEADETLDIERLGGLTLLGVAGFVDPPRPEAIEAVGDCHRAGIGVKMITGDHAMTARAIAEKLGLDTSAGVLTGANIQAIDDTELRRRVPEIDVFARTTPEHKLRLVEALQSHEQVVAMTGDGVNDAPALKRADVGIAMGIKGTEAAKEAARVVLADDNFASIAAAVREGRTIYDNLKKVIAWNLPTNGGESLVIILAILFSVTLPITPIQILWINMVTAVALGLTLAFEPAEPGLMDRKPRRMNASLLDPEMVWRVILVSILFALAVFGIFFWAQENGYSLDYARTLVVNLLVVMEIFYLFSVRYLHLTSLTWTGVLGTRAVLLGILAAALFQIAFTYTPLMQRIFATESVALRHGIAIVAIGGALLAILEGEKWFRRALSR